MTSSSIRKVGLSGMAALLLVSGLATSTLTAQGADNQSTPITLLQSPALGSLSSLGGVSGYIASQSGGDVDQWLSGQGVNPASSGPITDATLPDEAQGKVSVNGASVSLAPDAAGVDVGYLVGDAVSTDTVSADLTNITVASGHEADAFAMSKEEFLTWLSGTTWQGNYSLSGVASFNFTVAWSLNGAKVTPNNSLAVNLAICAQFQNILNNSLSTPASLKLSDVIAMNQQYSWNYTSDVPYSFAYALDQDLAPGNSVSVDLNDTISQSWLDNFNIANTQTSGVLTEIPLTSLMPSDAVQALSSLPGFSNFSGSTTTADLAEQILTDRIRDGVFDTWTSTVVTQQINTILDTINSQTVGYTMQPLNSASKAQIKTNTPAVMAMFIKDGFSTMLAQGISANIRLDATLAPGSVTNLVPTGVTYTAPIEVDTNSSTLTVSNSTMIVDPGICTGIPTTDPQSVTATATVIDTTGAPAVGADVTFGVDSPLQLDTAIGVTDENGVATAVITLPDPLAFLGTAHVTAHVDFGSGADLSPADLTVQQQVVDDTVVLPPLSVTPTLTSPVYANGDDSYTASITFTDQCGVPQSGKVVNFSVTGSAQLSTDSVTSNEDGVAAVTLTDEKVERVTVSATDTSGVPAAGPSTTVPFSYMPCTDDSCGPPIPVGGTLTIDPSEVSVGGSTIALASVVDGVGDPVPGVVVNFSLGGNAQFSDGSTAITSPADSGGQAAALISATTLDCDNLGFDVHASITVDGQVLELTGSPARVTVVPSDNACEVAVAPPQVEVANASIIDGSAVPGATVQVVDAASTVLGTSRVDATGYWSLPTPNGTVSQQITANALNRAGDVTASSTAWLDTDIPAPARIDRATTQDVAGTMGAVEPSSTVTVTFPDGTIANVVSNTDGSYTVETPSDMPEGVVTVLVTDGAGNPSDPATANLVTYVPPASKVTVALRSTQVDIGGIQVVSGWGFRYLERVSAQLCSQTCMNIGNGYADLNGKAIINFVVPNSVTPGDYTVTLTGATSGKGSAGFLVPAPTAPSEARLNTYLLLWAKWWWLLLLAK